MLSNIFLVALAASSVAAHGKIAVMTGDAGGNTTGLGIQGGVVPGPGKNKVTEVDTTVFQSKNAMTDGLGKTSAGPNTLAGMSAVIAQSGSTLAQVSDGGSISGTMHIVTTDGAGPYTAVLDTTGTGAFSQGTMLDVTTQVPGKRGNIAAAKDRRFVARALIKMGIMKRAANVNEDFPFAATVPAGTKCTGTVAGQSGVCLVKIVNPSGAGPFGGVMAIQMAGTGGAATSNSTVAAAPVASAPASTAAKGGKASKADKGAAKASAAAAADDSSSAGSDTTDAASDPDTKRALIGAKFRA